MRYFIFHLLLLLPVICFSQFKNIECTINNKIQLDSEILGLKSFSTNMLCRDFHLAYDDEKTTMYMLGQMDAGRHYTSYSSFGASFFSSLLFPPAGLVTSIVMSFSPPKLENYGLPIEKLPLLKDGDYYKAYSSSIRKRKTLRSWGGFVTGTAFFYAGLRMVGYNLEDYLFK